MSTSTEMRGEIRGKRGSEGEALPPATARGKIEVTHRKMLPHSQRKRGGNSMKVARRGEERQKGSCPQLEGKWGFEKSTEGQSDSINHGGQLSERQEGETQAEGSGAL